MEATNKKTVRTTGRGFEDTAEGGTEWGKIMLKVQNHDLTSVWVSQGTGFNCQLSGTIPTVRSRLIFEV